MGFFIINRFPSKYWWAGCFWEQWNTKGIHKSLETIYKSRMKFCLILLLTITLQKFFFIIFQCNFYYGECNLDPRLSPFLFLNKGVKGERLGSRIPFIHFSLTSQVFPLGLLVPRKGSLALRLREGLEQVKREASTLPLCFLLHSQAIFTSVSALNVANPQAELRRN